MTTILLQTLGLLIMDECHVARKKHPYAQIMGFYDALPVDCSKPLIFGMTASPTPEVSSITKCLLVSTHFANTV
jgi:ERCC4-related helicase